MMSGETDDSNSLTDLPERDIGREQAGRLVTLLRTLFVP